MLDAVKRVLLLLALLSSAAWAQTAAVGLTLAAETAAKAELALFGLPIGDIRLDLRAAGAIAAPLEVGLGLRTTLTLGPVGNVILSGRGDLATDGQFSAHLGGSAVLGALGVRAQLAAFNTDPGRFALAEAFAIDARARTGALQPGGIGMSLGVGVTYRLTRTVILDVDPELRYLSGQGLGGRLAATLQLRRFIDQDDGRLLLLADIAPGNARGFAAAGFEYRLTRRGLPVTAASLWLGQGSRGLWPGVRLSLSGQAAAGWQGGLELALEPYRTDAPRYRGRAQLRGPAGPGELSLTLFVAPGSDLPPIGLQSSYSLRF